jgi:hypothetical protein
VAVTQGFWVAGRDVVIGQVLGARIIAGCAPGFSNERNQEMKNAAKGTHAHFDDCHAGPVLDTSLPEPGSREKTRENQRRVAFFS